MCYGTQCTGIHRRIQVHISLYVDWCKSRNFIHSGNTKCPVTSRVFLSMGSLQLSGRDLKLTSRQDSVVTSWTCMQARNTKDGWLFGGQEYQGRFSKDCAFKLCLSSGLCTWVRWHFPAGECGDSQITTAGKCISSILPCQANIHPELHNQLSGRVCTWERAIHLLPRWS